MNIEQTTFEYIKRDAVRLKLSIEIDPNDKLGGGGSQCVV